MKTVHYLVLLVLCIVNNAFCQVQIPRLSPLSEIKQTIGLTKVEVIYSRPSIKGREVFGNLVPYGQLWRTGANENTTITFEDDVIFGNIAVKSGSYALYTIPNKDDWQIILYNSTDNWGTPKSFDDSKVVVTTKSKSIPLSDVIENFTISFSDLKSDRANLIFMWDKTKVQLPIVVPTDKKIIANVESPKNKISLDGYFRVANYFLQKNKNLEKVKKWIDDAVDMTSKNLNFRHLRVQSLLYAATGNKKEAIRTAKKSLKLAKKENNQNYVKMNQLSIKKWK